MDEYRYTVISLYQDHTTLKKSELMAEWKKDVGKVPSNAMYTKIMQEIATSKSNGHWVLKQ
jgi:hypothetical protein